MHGSSKAKKKKKTTKNLASLICKEPAGEPQRDNFQLAILFSQFAHCA